MISVLVSPLLVGAVARRRPAEGLRTAPEESFEF
jgi:hypothetical protein